MHKPCLTHVQAQFCICSASTICHAVGQLSGRPSCLQGQICRFTCQTQCNSRDICQHGYSHQHLTEVLGSSDGHIMTSIS